MFKRAFLFALMAGAASAPRTEAQTAPPATGITFQLPIVIVTAEKRPEDIVDVPVSVTAVQLETIRDADIRRVSDAARYAANVFMNEFTARKLSNPRIRGIGSSPTNPGVTTYIDGVPQLNANSSSVELIDVQQIEFIRGPQSALFGRNSVGGVINIASVRPSRTGWVGEVASPFGNREDWDLRGSASGPVSNNVSIGLAGGYAARDGFTTNVITGNDLDHRSATFGKAQLLIAPNDRWDARVILSGERARDGDYALSDLAGLRARPFQVARDFEGSTERSIVSPTFVLTRRGRRADVTSTTGVVWWRTDDLTDLDYTPLPLLRRSNAEHDLQVTQEVRASSSANAPVVISDRVQMAWQMGGSIFTQRYEQDAVNMLSPFVLSPLLGFAISQHSPDSTLNDRGVGIYGQGTWTFSQKLDVSAGIRADREKKEADINTSFTPAIAPSTALVTDRTFFHVSPQFSVGVRVAPRKSVYATVAQGYKAGGFNAASPPGTEAFSEENSWNYEGGFKSTWGTERVALNTSVFYIDWRDLQVNLPNPFVPGQYFIGNTGGATSKGIELELMARAAAGVDVFGSWGITRARYKDGSVASGRSIQGNTVPYAPTYTSNVGLQYSRPVRALTVYARGEVTTLGDFEYDETNAEGQDGYSLTSLRAGGRVGTCFVEGWIQNAFDTKYVPLAFPYPGLAPSGYIGEPGAPRRFGIRAGVRF